MGSRALTCNQKKSQFYLSSWLFPVLTCLVSLIFCSKISLKFSNQPHSSELFGLCLLTPLSSYAVSAFHRNVSSERSEARRKLRECSGLVDSLMYIVQSQINCKDVDNKVISAELL